MLDSVEAEHPSKVGLNTAQLLNLSRQQRNLLLLRPVFELESRKLQYESPSRTARLFEDIDTNYLVLSFLDFLMESVAVDSGRTTREVVLHLADLAYSMQSNLREDECLRVAEIILDAIANRNNKHGSFEYEFFDAPKKTMRVFRFKLVEYTPDVSGVYRFLPTREGYLVYLGMLDLEPDIAAELMDKMMQLLIERGRISEATEVAKIARTLSIEYSQNLRGLILRARRAPSSVKWSKEIEPKLTDARAHVEKRQSEDSRMSDSVETTLSKTFDLDARKKLIDFKTVVNSASSMRTRLLLDVMGAHEQFLDAQKMLFKKREASNLPDLENLMLPELMRLPLCQLTAFAEQALSAFLPPRVRKVFDLNTAMMVLLEKREARLVPEADDGEILPIVEPANYFSTTEIGAAKAWLTEKLDLVVSADSSGLLEAAIGDGLSRRECECLALLLYQNYSDDSALRTFYIYASGGRFEFEFARGEVITLKRHEDETFE